MAESGSPPRTLLLVRHGRTSWNAEGRAQGHADVPLDELGASQVAVLAPALAAVLSDHEVAALWSSDLKRATQTAAALAEAFGLQVSCDARLREFNVGERQGLTAAEYAERFPDRPVGLVGYPGSPMPLGAESVEQVRTRVSAALGEVLGAVSPGQTAIVVMHGAALRVALLDLLGWPWEQVQNLAPVRNCHWSEVRVEQSGLAHLVTYNASPGPDFTCGAGVR